jgi:hypothetical protein
MQKILRFWLLMIIFYVPIALTAADFNVTSPGSFYNINGEEPNPAITLTRGQTYTFGITTAADHPFAIVTEAFEFDVAGVSNNNTHDGTITFVVPLDAPDTLLYICSVHGFGNTITIIDPPPPPIPNVRIVSVSLTSSNVTLISTGTNGWTGIPEFSSNLLSGSWSVVPGYTNTFLNGTNTAVFNRLEVICGPRVFLRVKNTQD